MSEYCFHGMKARNCTLCKKAQERSLMVPKNQETPIPRLSPELQQLQVAKMKPHAEKRRLHSAEHRETKFGDYAIVSSRLAKHSNFLSHITPQITFVHLDGHPFVWVLQLIVDKIPGLKKIRFIPTMRKKLGQPHLKLLQERGIEIIEGHHRPEVVWKEGENRSKTYMLERQFMRNLSGSGREMFEELLQHGFEQAEITARYFCLKDEPFIFQAEIAKLHGYDGNNVGPLMSRKIKSVLSYLDPVQFPVSGDTEGVVRAMARRIKYLRELLVEENHISVFLKDTGLPQLPKGMKLSKLPELKAVHEAKQSGELEKLKIHNGDDYETLILRYGLDDGIFRTLEEIGQMKNLSRERIRQREEKAFSFLAINVE